MSEMKVGDIGVLQNLPPATHKFSGVVAEIIGTAPRFSRMDWEIRLMGVPVDGYAPWILKHQIRPLADPDHTETTTEEEVEA